MIYVTKGGYENVISGLIFKVGREAKKTISQNLLKPMVLLK